MIPLTDEYFEDEIREGCYVPSELKQAWGAEITVLNEIDRVCKKHGLHYFACWGTLLGAVRHGGIIPWDDDFDICMLRDDYEKFMQVWKDELPEGYDIINYKTHPNHIQFISNVVAKSHACFEKDHLEKFHGFPYIAGIDIFLMDYMSENPEEHKRIMKISDLILKIADGIYGGSINGKFEMESLAQIEKWCQTKIPKQLKGVDLRIFLYKLAEKCFSKVQSEQSQNVLQVVPWGFNGRDYVFPKEYFTKAIELPFETGTIPVSPYYSCHIYKSYYDYMAIHKDVGGHNFPFFDKQREGLEEVFGFEMPGFKFDTKILNSRKDKSAYNNSYRNIALNHVHMIEEEISSLVVNSKEKITANDKLETRIALLQQLAIELGTFIEEIKGEGYISIRRLEGFCEKAYQYFIDQKPATIDEMSDIIERVKNDIQNRKEIIFLPFKAKYWTAMEDEYNKAIADPNNDVFVVPISYYYKNYDETLRDEQYDLSAYSEELKPIAYYDIDLSLHHPDKIIIQNPYDEFNKVTSVNPKFYSRELVKYTDELVYIPWFTTNEFDKSDGRACKNMRYYVQMPGVVNADKVFVQSENVRGLYIDKLCEFAGEDTRDIWESKIAVQDKPLLNQNTGDYNEKNSGEVISNADGNDFKASNVKTIIYLTDPSCILVYKEKAFDKIKRVINLFEEESKKSGLKVNWCTMPFATTELSEDEQKIIDSYLKLREELIKNDFIEDTPYPGKDNANELIDGCDAYYGDAGVLAHLCRNAKMPVMIQNYDI